jgi:hypothetical protein
VLTIAGMAVAAATLMNTAATLGRAQDCVDLKSALVDYSKADLEPRKACQAVAKFKSKEIVQISANMMPAGEAPAHCRVTGILSPEIAFEVSTTGPCLQTALRPLKKCITKKITAMIK